MSDADQLDPQTAWYYNLSDGSVSQGPARSTFDRMGPYPSKETAEAALEIARERNKAADDEDRKWR